MNKLYKCSTDKKQIETLLSYIGTNKIEVQLLGNDKIENFLCCKDKVISFHLPFEFKGKSVWCNISNLLEIFNSTTEDKEYLDYVINYAKDFNAQIVMHDNLTLNEFIQNKNTASFIDWLSKTELEWHLENVTDEVKSQEDSIISPIEICNYINLKTGKKIIYPLLDICHFQMVRHAFDSDLKWNLREVIELYRSKNMFIHFSNIQGSGDNDFGGVHGYNFSNDLILLPLLVKELKKYNPTLVLGIHEDDLYNKPRAQWLSNKIDEY